MLLATVFVLAALGAGGCGSTTSRTYTVTTTVTTPSPPTLPGTGKPPITVGDKNFTEQFVLGELYYQALKAQGYTVSLNRNIGPTEVTMRALQSGTLSLYPEYVGTWDSDIAGLHRHFSSARGAFRAAQTWARVRGFRLLEPTPFSDTNALAVNFNYGVQHGLVAVDDLRKVAGTLTIGGPPQFQQSASGLPAIQADYGVVPAVFKPLEVGDAYQALDSGLVQAAEVNTTDGQLITGNYTLLKDPQNVFGWGNVAPVVPLKVLTAEGPRFAATINRVSALLTMTAIRQLNAAVDVDHADPATVATEFLTAHGVLPPSTP